VAQAVPDVSYTIVGAGDDLPRLRALASASGVADRIEFKGALEHHELLDEYSSCDIFVLPSAKEGFGLVFLEAMAFEKPVVARAARAASEVVEEGETGVLVRDEPELAPALIELLGDRDRASRMGTAGRRRLTAEFSLERFEGRMAALIEEVSALSGPASQRVRWLGRD
jgi:phosphatidyl-myo-inositol dimannoside synthase